MIQSHLLVKIDRVRYERIINSINEFQSENRETGEGLNENLCRGIQRDINDFHCRLIVAKVLQTYFAVIPMNKEARTRNDEVFQRFMLALYTNFREHRDVQFYAHRSGVSLKYFSTLVRHLSGSTPSQWIETVVAEEAKSMLADNQKSIKDVATVLHFPDAPTFTKYFRRITGLTPKDYRKTIH